MKDGDIVVEGGHGGTRCLGIGDGDVGGLARAGRVQVLPINNAADDEGEGDAHEDEPAELAFPKKIETMDVHAIRS